MPATNCNRELTLLTAGIYAYVSLKESDQPNDNLRKEMVQTVRKEIGGKMPKVSFIFDAVLHSRHSESLATLIVLQISGTPYL